MRKRKAKAKGANLGESLTSLSLQAALATRNQVSGSTDAASTPTEQSPTITPDHWPTPTKGNADRGGDVRRWKGEQSLGGRRSNLHDAAMSTASGLPSSGSPVSTAKRGQLNPDLSRWLMGYPVEWLFAAPSNRPAPRFKKSIGTTGVEHSQDSATRSSRNLELAPRTIRHISGVLHKLFKSAEIENLITKNPVKYEAGTLPKKLDKDPTWRAQAIYTREEIEQLISDERIPQDRRVLYALKFFTGRHSELSSLTWSQYDAAPKPLGALNLSNTKTGVPRPVPVHPTLAKILAEWKLSGWDDFYGHKPRPIDLIVPSRNGRKRTANGAQDQLVYDLGKIGLRVEAGKTRRRRGHDLRRTLITLARTDGAIDSLLRWVTHGARPNEILDQYSSPPWEALCAEVAKIKIERREGRVIAMAANDQHGSGLVQRGPVSNSVVRRATWKRPRRDSNPSSGAGSDARSQEKPTLGIVRTSSNDADEPGTGPSRGPVESRCDVGFALLREAARE